MGCYSRSAAWPPRQPQQQRQQPQQHSQYWKERVHERDPFEATTGASSQAPHSAGMATGAHSMVCVTVLVLPASKISDMPMVPAVSPPRDRLAAACPSSGRA